MAQKAGRSFAGWSTVAKSSLGTRLLELASRQICQNARQLADDMYVEVIYLSIFLWNSDIHILVQNTPLCYHNFSRWCCYCAENIAQQSKLFLLRVKPQLRLRWQTHFTACLSLSPPPTPLPPSTDIGGGHCVTGHVSHPGTPQVHHSSGPQHGRHTLRDTRHICDRFLERGILKQLFFFCFLALEKKHYFMSMHLLENLNDSERN